MKTITERLEILKTYKLYIDGQFPRTESGRYYSPKNKEGVALGNICLSSRKDFRNAVVAARKAQGSWASKTAYNRSQIIYRIAEMLETRKAQFIEELTLMGFSKKEAEQEVIKTIDLIVYYSGWADKYQQVFSSVNPVAGSFFNFSVYEPTGVVAAISTEESPLFDLISIIIPCILGGNSIIILASESLPLCAVTFGEVLNSSDLPGGVVNILTGNRKELLEHFSNHMDVNAIVYAGNEIDEITKIKEVAGMNLKRVINYYKKFKEGSPYFILDTQEVKTTWHPIENIGTSGGKY